jgi:hypothetical protein
MKHSITRYMSPGTLATRWECHRSTATRTMKAYGYAGLKMGSTRTSLIRFAIADVEAVERLLAIRPNVRKNSGGESK